MATFLQKPKSIYCFSFYSFSPPFSTLCTNTTDNRLNNKTETKLSHPLLLFFGGFRNRTEGAGWPTNYPQTDLSNSNQSEKATLKDSYLGSLRSWDSFPYKDPLIPSPIIFVFLKNSQALSL